MDAQVMSWLIKGLTCVITTLTVVFIIIKRRKKKTEYYFLRYEHTICQKCCIEQKSVCKLKTCSYLIIQNVIDLISNAKTSLEMCSPSFRFKYMTAAIKRANANNVQVRIITSHVESLIECCALGIPVKGHDCKKQCYLLHNKFIIIDRKILIRSSLNFAHAILQGNCENLQIIFDADKISWYQSFFNDIWQYNKPCPKCNNDQGHDYSVDYDTDTPSDVSVQATRIAMSVPQIKLLDGNQIPAFGLGTWQAEPGVVGSAVKLAIDAGYRHIDCALLYSNEREIGEAIREKIAEGVVKREDLFITSKLWNSYHRPDLVVKGCKKTVSNFGLDYIDLYLIHWPFGFKPTDRADAQSKSHPTLKDILADQEFWPRDDKGQLIFSDDDYVDTWKEMEKCVELGLTKSIGVSNFNGKQLDRILKVCKIKPVNNQIEIHPYLTQKEIRDYCREKGISVTAYCPLGQPKDGATVKVLENPVILKIAQEVDRRPAQVVLRYLIQLGVIPIPKSTNPARLVQNFYVFDFTLTERQMNEIAKLDTNQRICPMEGCENHKHYPF